MTASRDDHVKAEQVRSVLSHVRYTPIDEVSRLQSIASAHRDELSSLHHLNGLTVDSVHPILFIPLPLNVANDRNRPEEIKFLPANWLSGFGASFTFGVWFLDRSDAANPRFCLTSIKKAQAETLTLLKRGYFEVALVQGGNVRWAWSFDFTEQPALQYLQKQINEVQSSTAPRLFPDDHAHHWRVVNAISLVHSELTKKDKLSVSWSTKYRTECHIADDLLEHIRSSYPVPLPGDNIPDGLRKFYAIVEECDYDLRQILSVIASKKRSAPFWFDGSSWDLPDAEQHTAYIDTRWQLLTVIQLSPELTECGQSVMYLNRQGGLEQLSLKPESFLPSFKPEDFWNRFPSNSTFRWGTVLTGADFPADRRTFLDNADSFPVAVDAGEVSLSADLLLDEAVTSKRGTIPQRAVVDIQIGPFVELELIESPDDVSVICRCADGSVHIVTVDPLAKFCSFQLPMVSDVGLPPFN
jgi:hypothetical protein